MRGVPNGVNNIIDRRSFKQVGYRAIGKGSPHKQDTHEVHGAPLGADEVAATKTAIGFIAFGVPPILIQETEKTSSWGTGVEQIIIGFVRFTMAPHLERFRDELNRKLFRRAGRAAEFDTDALTRPDSKGFGEMLRNLVGGSQGPGIISVNEARSALRRPPKIGADELYAPKVTANAQPDQSPDPQSPDPGAAV